MESFWQLCDECSKLGVHNIEINSTNRKIVDVYESRISEFRDELSKRGLTLLGSAMYSHMHIPELRQDLIDMHLRVARFLKAANDTRTSLGNLGNVRDSDSPLTE